MNDDLNEHQLICYFTAWKERKLCEEEIRKELFNKNYPVVKIDEIISLYHKKQLDARFTKGFVLMGTGAFIGFLSCLFAILDFAPAWRYFYLYGLTSISVIIAMAGCYLVFERE